MDPIQDHSSTIALYLHSIIDDLHVQRTDNVMV